MNIVGICRIKNNQDIIEPFIRHHLRFFDYFLICDNGSVDATPRIIKAMAEEDPRLILSDDPSFGDRQVMHYTKLLRDAAKFSPTYVVPLDSDEFIQVKSRAALEESFSRIRFGEVGFMPWKTYCLTPETLEACAEDSPKGFRWRRKTEDTPHGAGKDFPICKIVLYTESQNLHDYALWIGNHGTNRFSTNREVPGTMLDIPLLHFPVRSLDHVIAKTVVNWAAFLIYDKQVRENECIAWHNIRNFDRLIIAGGFTERDLLEMSADYAQNKHPDLVEEDHGIQYERRYSTGRHMSALPLIAKAWEQSIVER